MTTQYRKVARSDIHPGGYEIFTRMDTEVGEGRSLAFAANTVIADCVLRAMVRRQPEPSDQFKPDVWY